MKTRIFTLFIFSITLFAILSPKGDARTLFFADFEPNSRKAIPNKAVNDPGNWKPENPQTQWTIGDFANGTKALKQVTEGCAASGNTPLPGMTSKFTNGIIQLEMSAGDDDSWGVIFRKSEEKKGYLVVFGVTETPFVIVALLDKNCGIVGKCLDEVACENNPANTLIQVPHGMQPMDQTNGTIYFGRVEAIGDTIKVWYMKRDDVKDPDAKDLGEPIAEVKDNTHKSGAVGIWHETMSNSMIDNVLVDTGMAVNTEGKLATTWGDLKERY